MASKCTLLMDIKFQPQIENLGLERLNPTTGAKQEELSKDERLTRKMSRLKTHSLFQKGKLEAKT